MPIRAAAAPLPDGSGGGADRFGRLYRGVIGGGNLPVGSVAPHFEMRGI